MDQENRIEELKETIGRIINDAMYHILDEDDSRYLAKELIDKGYRKAYEVAREIFEEIEKKVLFSTNTGVIALLAYNELKKKYTLGENNDG